jgi:crotonobetainyl-CoA:carnitine CoA-transferase CaiB-like acyl-CoA transferase
MEGDPMILSGVRVLELSIAWAGPLAGRWLADLGAEVIKIEHRTARGVGVTGTGGYRAPEDVKDWEWGRLPGPVYRSGIFPDAEPGDRPWNRQSLFNKLQRNKLSLCIDLKATAAHDVMVDLVKVSDIVVDNYSPGAIRHLGLDYETLRTYNPSLIRISMSGYGHTGPAQAHPSWGPILEAQSGMSWTTGYPEAGPLKVGAAFPDPIGGLHGVVAILAALDERDRTGAGCSIDLSQFETYAAIGGEKYLAASATEEPSLRLGNRSLDNAPQGVYPCRGDDSWVAISISNDEEWQALASVLGGELVNRDLATLDGRRRDHDNIDIAIASWSRQHDRFEAMRELQSRGIRASAVMTNQDIVEDEHMAARDFIVQWDQVDVGWRRYPGFPVHFEDPAVIPMSGAPGLGADNERVMVEILGYPTGRFNQLTKDGVLATTPE